MARGDAGVDLARDEEHQILARVAEDAVEDDQHAEQSHHGSKSLVAAMADGLVDQHLEQHRDGEADEARHQRRERHVAQVAALTHDLGQEPREAELVRRRRHGLLRPLGDEDEAGPFGHELVPRHQDRAGTLGTGVEHDGGGSALFLGHVDEQNPGAAALLHHHGAGGAHVLEVLPALVAHDLAGEPDLAQNLQARTDEIGLADRGDVLGLQMRTALQAHDEQAAQRGVMGRQDDVGGGVHGREGALEFRGADEGNRAAWEPQAVALRHRRTVRGDSPE